MKANELMIGDWVIFVDEPLKVQHLYNNGYDDVVAEIVEEGTNEYGVYEEIKDVPVVYCSPIPLTPEILEKNGFKKIDFSHYQINDRTLVLDADGKWDGEVSWHWVVTEMSTNSKGQNVVLDYYVATLNYAHQLQHALRLCGLNELADNFKI